MRPTLALIVLGLAGCAAAPAPIQSATRENRISIYLGQRNLDEDDWEPVEEQATFGLEFSRETAGSPVGFEIGLMGSADEADFGGADVEGTTGELYGGLRKTFGGDVVRPYVGGGIAFITAEAEISGVGSDDDSSPAGYLHGGIDFDVTDSFFLGIDLRFLFASDIEIAGFETDADYVQFALVLGFVF